MVYSGANFNIRVEDAYITSKLDIDHGIWQSANVRATHNFKIYTYLNVKKKLGDQKITPVCQTYT